MLLKFAWFTPHIIHSYFTVSVSRGFIQCYNVPPTECRRRKLECATPHENSGMARRMFWNIRISLIINDHAYNILFFYGILSAWGWICNIFFHEFYFYACSMQRAYIWPGATRHALKWMKRRMILVLFNRAAHTSMCSNLKIPAAQRSSFKKSTQGEAAPEYSFLERRSPPAARGR